MEGGCEGCDWAAWERLPGRIAGGRGAGRACEWWEGRAEEDLARAAASGQNAHRLSLEWSRLEPEPGRYAAAAFDRYRRLLEHLRRLGMTAMVTLYHFTLPRWQAERGGWRDERILDRFAALAAECARRLGDLVPLWITINEPFSLLYHGYLCRRWPPGGAGLPGTLAAAARLFRAHALAYHALRAEAPASSRVGIAHIMQRFLPASPSPLDRLAARLQDRASVESWLLPLRTGRLHFPWSLALRRVPDLAGTVDFLGVNYYGTYRVRFDPTRLTLGRWVQAGTIRHGSQDWGAPEPDGLRDGLLRAAALGVPVYVTENGTCDAADALRPGLLRRHLEAVREAIAAGADARGYFHWSLLDNFEWAEGWETRFGLIEVDPVTQERRERSSFEQYGRVARANGLADGEF